MRKLKRFHFRKTHILCAGAGFKFTRMFDYQCNAGAK